MVATTQVVRPAALRDWVLDHLEVVDGRCPAVPPAAVARLTGQLVELVAGAHERGWVLPGLGPDALVVTAAGAVRPMTAARPGSADERAADLLGLGSALWALATGTELDPVRGPVDAGDHDRLARLVRWSAGNPCVVGLAPLVLALRHPDPALRPGPAALRMLLTGRPPAVGTVGVRLAGG
jgi:hypothetical protein